MGAIVSVQPVRASGYEQTAGRAPAHEGLIDRLAVAAINGYQRYLSPRKGFKCAHRKLHGQESCSQYIKRIVEQEGLGRALSLAPVRFKACSAASRILRAEMIAPDGDSPDPATGQRPRRAAWGSGTRGDDQDGLCGSICCGLEALSDLPGCSVISVISSIFS